MTRSILDKKFKYVPAAATDVRKTFRKYRRLQQMRERASNVAQISEVSKKKAKVA